MKNDASLSFSELKLNCNILIYLKIEWFFFVDIINAALCYVLIISERIKTKISPPEAEKQGFLQWANHYWIFSHNSYISFPRVENESTTFALTAARL